MKTPFFTEGHISEELLKKIRVPNFHQKETPIPTEEELFQVETVTDLYVAKVIKRNKLEAPHLVQHQMNELLGLVQFIFNPDFQKDSDNFGFALPPEALKVVKDTIDNWNLDEIYAERKIPLTKEDLKKLAEEAEEKEDISPLKTIFQSNNQKEKELVLMHLMKDGLCDKLSFIPSDKLKWKYFFNSFIRICKVDLNKLQSSYIRMHMLQFGYHPLNINSVKAFYLLDKSPVARIKKLQEKIKELERTDAYIAYDFHLKQGLTSMFTILFPKLRRQAQTVIGKIVQLNKKIVAIKEKYQTINMVSNNDLEKDLGKHEEQNKNLIPNEIVELFNHNPEPGDYIFLYQIIGEPGLKNLIVPSEIKDEFLLKFPIMKSSFAITFEQEQQMKQFLEEYKNK